MTCSSKDAFLTASHCQKKDQFLTAEQAEETPCSIESCTHWGKNSLSHGWAPDAARGCSPPRPVATPSAAALPSPCWHMLLHWQGPKQCCGCSTPWHRHAGQPGAVKEI
eukprot:1133151-Pelagomonas_calceolata.AAC.3